jgi:hypothetical protein
MRRVGRILFASVLVLGLLVAQRSQAAPNNAAASAAFDLLKSLVGHWETEKSSGQHAEFDIELTAGGTALIEKYRGIGNGKPIEMISLYYLDGDQLKMTHYCMAGNQPTLRATYEPESKTLTFNFESATNLKTPNDGHMHHAVYIIVDSDHLRTRWTYQKDQKDAFTEDVTYIRMK